jgi:hypothetical protein
MNKALDLIYDLVVFICPNGGGHHKRVFGALALILRRCPELKVIVFADKKTTEKFSNDFEPLQGILRNPNVKFIYGVVSPGVDIMAEDPSVYTNGQWFSWLNRVKPYKDIIENTKVVWADALPQILMFRPDTILSSSFTFGPIILSKWGKREDNLGRMARTFAKQEDKLLKKHRPRYIAVELLSMIPEDRARLKKVGIMADFEPLSKIKSDKPVIAVSGGLTGLAGENLAAVVGILMDEEKYEIVVDRGLSSIFPNLPVLGHSAKDYAQLSASICRPGAGELTNAITSSTPVITIYESQNPEMKHNGSRIQEFSLGIQIHNPKEVLQSIKTILSKDWQKKYAAARARVRTDGLQSLSNEILKTL